MWERDLDKTLKYSGRKYSLEGLPVALQGEDKAKGAQRVRLYGELLFNCRALRTLVKQHIAQNVDTIELPNVKGIVVVE